jgi:hypothetical protein
MHTQAGIKERFVQDLQEAASEMRKEPAKKDEGRVSAFEDR